MRPVLLEMDGFASYRQYTRMDFDAVDYFALVGPTGAGKSTIIDAITFALYGCVVRWDDARAVEPALAPTVNRGSLKLVFDAGLDRYVAVRVLQRSGAGKVGQKTARLERLVDPSTRGTADDATVVIADGIDETKQAVERLLGLDFGQFTKCVALPQGQFAELLHAKAGDRDKILTKLLGLDVYLQVGQAANKRASLLRTKADALQHQLDDEKLDSTDAALAAAETQVQAFEALRARIDEDVARLNKLIESAVAADRERKQRDEQIEQLKAVAVPTGTVDLDDRVQAAVNTHKEAEAGAQAAEQADSDARKALTAHPKRSTLERLQDAHAERSRLQKLQPELSEKVTSTTRAAQLAQDAFERARTELEVARRNDIAAADAYKLAADTRSTATEKHDLLESVEVPAGLDEITSRIADAQAKATEARKQLNDAKDQRRIAEAALAQHPTAIDLERASRAIHDARVAVVQFEEAVTAVVPAHKLASSDRTTAASAAAALAEAIAEAEAIQTRAVAAELRSHLEVGHECPVCEQRVVALPAPLDASRAEEAKKKVDAAQKRVKASANAAPRSETQLEAQRNSVITAAQHLTTRLAAATTAMIPAAGPAVPEITIDTDIFEQIDVDTEAEFLATECDALTVKLETAITALDAVADHLASAQAARTTAETAAQDAEHAATNAGEQQRSAEDAMEKMAAERVAAQPTLQQTRDPLVALGAPSLDDQDLAAAWDCLAAWASEAAKAQADVVAQAEQLLAARDSERKASGEALDLGKQAYDDAETERTKTVTEQQLAAAELEQCDRQVAGFESELLDAPSAEDVSKRLLELSVLESRADSAAGNLELARNARNDATAELESVTNEERSARAALNAARDGLVAIGRPPTADGVNIAKAWGDLVEWAATTAAEIAKSRDQAAAIAEGHGRDSDQLIHQMREVLTDAGVDTEDSRSPHIWAAAAVAGAVAQASAAVQHIREARDRRASTIEEIAKAREHSAVAKQLGDLLAIDGFPRWLNRNALEVLATSASETLMDLSGGQFELSLSDAKDANFTIIDHADADAMRPVKTLSGGETFQASLSLALALAQNLGALANSGAAKLEALFIDEGFGTLDETTLDVVANTLETLAMNAGRMVGVVTHVPGLAARVPVRFRVDRDPRGSTVYRETP